MQVPDPVNGGKPAPVLVARLYLMDQVFQTLKCDGKVSAQLYFEGPPETGGQPVLVEQWNLDAKTLERLGSHDMIGWGYTLLLPWGTCNPTVTKVELVLCYHTVEGVPLYSRNKLTLQHEERPFHVTTTIQTGDGKVIEKK